MTDTERKLNAKLLREMEERVGPGGAIPAVKLSIRSP